MWMLVSVALGLFWSAFLAATVLPFSSEAALSAALLAGLPPVWCLGIATLGNSLGSAATFFLGRLGKLEWLEKYCRISAADIKRARKRIGRLGYLAAFFCFLPVVGDVFAVALGFMRYPAGRFLGVMMLGKFVRYAVWMALHFVVLQTAS